MPADAMPRWWGWRAPTGTESLACLLTDANRAYHLPCRPRTTTKEPTVDTLKRIGPAIGVIASMLLVSYEVRQNTNATRGATLQAISDQSIHSILAVLEYPELGVAWQRTSRGLQYMTAEDQHVLLWWYTSLMRIHENRFLQVELGTVDSRALEQLGATSEAYQHPYFAQYWAGSSGGATPEFRAFVEESLLPLVRDSLPTPTMPLPEVLATWDSIDRRSP